MRLLVILPILLLIISIFTQECGNHNDIHNFPSDSINVYAPLKPNEEGLSGRHTYGEDSVIGNTITYRLSTNSIRRDVDIDFTILELHPNITANLLSFIHEELFYPGLLDQSDSIIPSIIDKKLNNGYTQHEIAKTFLNYEHNHFDLFPNYHYGIDEEEYCYDINVYPVFLNEKYVTYIKSAYARREGALPHERLYFQTFNRESGESVELSDIVWEDSIKKIRELIAYHLAGLDPVYSPPGSIAVYLDSLNLYMGIPEDVDRGISSNDVIQDLITLNNFPINAPWIHDKGSIFSYDQFELTPGINGCPVILLQYEAIGDYLKEPITHWFDSLKNSTLIP